MQVPEIVALAGILKASMEDISGLDNNIIAGDEPITKNVTTPLLPSATDDVDVSSTESCRSNSVKHAPGKPPLPEYGGLPSGCRRCAPQSL